jgi:hypothetical protein
MRHYWVDGGGLLSLVGPLASRLVAERTVRFIKDNYGNFSREGLRYAIEVCLRYHY